MKIFNALPGDSLEDTLNRMMELSYKSKEKYVVDFNGSVLVIDAWECVENARRKFNKDRS